MEQKILTSYQTGTNIIIKYQFGTCKRGNRVMDNKSDMYTVEEFAEKAKITTAHARQLLREKKLKGIKVGKSWKISKVEVNSYLGIQTDIGTMEREILISELQNKLVLKESQLENLKSIVGVLANMVGI